MNTGTVLVLAALVGSGMLAWRRGASGMAAGLIGLALLPAVAIIEQTPPAVLVGAGLVTAVLGWHQWSRTSTTVTRWGARSRRKEGVASTLDIARLASGPAMRRKATTVRPSLAEMPAWRRWRVRVVEFAVPLCRAGLVRVWASIEDVVCAFGGPRTGKTGWLGGKVIDAPGAAVVTSTRTDLHDLTAPLRTATGPVYVFNAVGIGGLASTITFDPLTGCTDPVAAAERATDMLTATSRSSAGGDREFWDGQGRRVLTALLHAAALGGRHMRDVLGWVADPDRARAELTSLVRKSGEPAFEEDLAQFVSTNERTRSSITSTIMPALGWLMSPAASAAAEPGCGFDVAELLERRATVYLLGAEETHTAPLVCALTGHIAREARRIAARQPAGRLDPPLTLVLDEAALISPVPLHSWTADMGGRGVTILAAFQSRAQLLARYGEHNAATILNNTGAVLLFGGTRDRDDLQFWSTLGGDRDERITTTDLHGRVASRTVRKVPVLAPAQIANLPTGRVMVFRRGLAPVIGRAQMVWRRRDVRAQACLVRRVERSVRFDRWIGRQRARRGALLEAVVSALAARWPARFGELAARVRASNAMFAELRAIQDATEAEGRPR